MSETLRPAFNLAGTLDTISGFMYTYVLVALLIGAGLYFFIRTRALPLRLFKEAVRVVTEPPHEEGEVSSFRALMVSTASRVASATSPASPPLSLQAAPALSSGCG